ncbi:hypothetical protein LTR56_019969 [Elasticomyces elasticus]|nr:hypothetical protein LTR56_019969 [Elasticomyces elasticus]KAK3634078.1 hypothetical protein LTR22_019810 [Elasticomyces elasticus]KAK4911163.1 hypothetical protein LTR49_020235 [Elasticomyces elasticus]KAK5748000.1 hypothetical protein LTS12_021929 [Elasticomyces elasticus]
MDERSAALVQAGTQQYDESGETTTAMPRECEDDPVIASLPTGDTEHTVLAVSVLGNTESCTLPLHAAGDAAFDSVSSGDIGTSISPAILPGDQNHCCINHDGVQPAVHRRVTEVIKMRPCRRSKASQQAPQSGDLNEQRRSNEVRNTSLQQPHIIYCTKYLEEQRIFANSKRTQDCERHKSRYAYQDQQTQTAKLLQASGGPMVAWRLSALRKGRMKLKRRWEATHGIKGDGRVIASRSNTMAQVNSNWADELWGILARLAHDG